MKLFHRENMQITISLVTQKDYLLFKVTGYTSFDELQKSFDRGFNHPDCVPGMSRLWDINEADFSGLLNDEFEILCNYASVFPAGFNDVNVAIVSNNSTHTVHLDLLKKYTLNSSITTQVFKTFDGAEEWISQDG